MTEICKMCKDGNCEFCAGEVCSHNCTAYENKQKPHYVKEDLL